MTKGEKQKIIDMRITLLLEAVEQMREDLFLSNGRSLLPRRCVRHKLREALKP